MPTTTPTAHATPHDGAATRLVEIRLSALTRVEYTETVRVPANLTAGELNELVNQRNAATDGGEFVADPDYWERGTCYATGCDDPNAEPSLEVVREDGALRTSRVTAAPTAGLATSQA